MATLAYEIVDVFTDRPFTGNPLAVVFGAEHLAGAQLQSLAREFHLSETAFVLPPTVDQATYRLRIFTPEAELPFAGHPSVGAAVTQLRRGAIEAGPIVQECGAGLLSLTVRDDGSATLTGGAPRVGLRVDPELLLKAVDLDVEDLVGADLHPARLAGCGLEFAYLPVRPEAVGRAVAPAASPDLPMITVLAWDPGSATAHVRVFCPGAGVPEDPATGSAALGLGVWLVVSGLLPPDGTARYTVRQGAELHRPSTLDCTVDSVAGIVSSATVTGHVVPIASGAIVIPPFVG